MRDDLRTAFRSLRHSPTFTVVALTVLALGIGAGTAIFSVVDAVVLRGLPFDQHDRLGVVLEHDTEARADVRRGQHHAADLSGLAADAAVVPGARRRQRQRQFRLQNGDRRAGRRARPAGHARSSSRCFASRRCSGARSLPDDEIDGRHRVAILSYGFWQRRFGGAPDVVGKTLDLNEETWEIVGVMPRELRLSGRRASGRPRSSRRSCSRAEDRTPRRQPQLQLDGDRPAEARRLDRPGARADEPRRDGARRAVSRSGAPGPARARDHAARASGRPGAVVDADAARRGRAGAAHRLRQRRQPDAGARDRRGAARWASARRSARAAGGWSAACWSKACVLSLDGGGDRRRCSPTRGIAILRAWLPAGLPRVAAYRDRSARARWPRSRAAVLHRPDLRARARAPRRRGRISRRRSRTAADRRRPAAAAQRLRSALVVAEVALAVVLLVGAGLFIGSFVQLMRVDPGFDYRNVLVLNVGVRLGAGQTFDERRSKTRHGRTSQQMLDAVRPVPGVADARGGQRRPAAHRQLEPHPRRAAGPAARSTGTTTSIDRRTVTPNYLRAPADSAAARPLLLTADDRDGSPLVVVINEAAAREGYWPGQDALGQRHHAERQGARRRRHRRQHPSPRTRSRRRGRSATSRSRRIGHVGATLVIRTAGDPLARAAGGQGGDLVGQQGAAADRATRDARGLHGSA